LAAVAPGRQIGQLSADPIVRTARTGPTVLAGRTARIVRAGEILAGAGIPVGGGILAGVGGPDIRGITGLGIGTGEITGGIGRLLSLQGGGSVRGPGR
jgi:hypothetical protein